MNRRFALVLGVVLVLGTEPGLLKAQSGDIRIRAGFHDLPFPEFVARIEVNEGITFYYRDAWVKGIRVTAEGEQASLKEILNKTLLPAGLSYHVDEAKQVFLTPGGPLVTRLPDYRRRAAGEGGEGPEQAEGLTQAELKYIEGRKAGLLETVRVGSGNGSKDRAVVHGRVSDRESGEPLIGATVYFGEIRKGAATDVNGHFSLVVPPDKYTVEFNCMGMEARILYVEVLSDGELAMDMEKNLIPLTEVVIKANRFDNVKGTQMGFERLNYQVMDEVPVVMGEKDVLKVIQMLPGVQSVGEGAAGFNVRGSGADQNMIYINKVPVYNSSHLFGFFTTFNPDIIKDFTLYKSNLPAHLGGRLSSVFDITTRQGNLNELTARGGISPVTGHVALEGPIVKGKSAFILSGRTTYSDWMLNRMEDPELRNSEAGFYDAAGALSWEADDRTLVKVFLYGSQDRFSLGSRNQYTYANEGASLNVRRRHSTRTTGDLALAYGSYRFRTTDRNVPSESYSHAYRIDHVEAKADYTWLSLGKHRLTYGGSAILYRLDRGAVEPFGEESLRSRVDLGRENGLEFALYAADEINLTDRLTLYGGLRVSSFLALGPEELRLYSPGQEKEDESVTDIRTFRPGEVSKLYGGPEPRVAVTWLTGSSTSLKFSYNRARQYLFMLSNTIAVSPTDQWKLSDYHLRPPVSDQVSVGFYKDFPSQSITTSLEVYRKWVHHVVEYKDGATFIQNRFIETETLQGDQDAYGFEAMVRKGAGKFNGWVAYSYTRSFMLVDSDIRGESINQGNVYPSNYDRPHNVSVVSNYKLNRRLSFSANLVYTTGRPVTLPVSIYYVDGMEFIDYSDRNAYRIPDYFRMDFSLNLEGNLRERKAMHSYWMLNFYNVTGRRNPYSVFFQSEEGVVNGYQLSIFGQPVVTLSWHFKLGNYASE